MKSIFVTCLFLGCLALNSTAKSADVDTADLEKACAESEPGSCQKLQQALNEPSQVAEHACYAGDMSGCYDYGVIREKRRDDYILMMQPYQMACKGNEARACEAIKRILNQKCIDKKLKADTECYEKGPEKRLSSGTSIIPYVRVHNANCDVKEKAAQEGGMCAAVASFELSQGHPEEAEKVYRSTCTSSSNNSGCGGLVCIGYFKANQKKLDEAKKLFKTACDFSYIKPGTQDGAAAAGCTALPDQKGWTNKKNYQAAFKSAVEGMKSKEDECIRKLR